MRLYCIIGEMITRLLATKFHIPPWRASGVRRPRLLERLDAGLREGRRLSLISAPAGYGKTTLVAEWIHSLRAGGRHAAWLSLDAADNDPERFLRYLAAAFRQAGETAAAQIQPLFDLPRLPPAGALLDALINALDGAEAPILLALEDYHVITEPEIHEGLQYFLDHLPAGVHLVLTTREDPPLPLPRLRARGQMTEIRAHDLRFTPAEARQFLLQSLNVELAEEAAQALEKRTEGWAVGLQLAGLALQNIPDPRAFIENFRGSHRYVLDYLAEEVIRQQGEEMQRFLTQTSVLERFNAPACAALTGRADAQELIAQLERANLFIVPLDDERRWYRYHHLFADYLRTLLGEAEQAALYKKASAWHEANDLLAEAAQYALASRDYEFAADLIERAVSKSTAWSGGNLVMLSGWLDALPPQALQRRPGLSLSASRILYLSGRFDQAEKHIAQTEAALKAQPASPETGQMLALAALYHGSIAAVRGDFRQAVDQTTYALERIPRDNHLAHARGYFSLGQAYELADQPDLAVENFLRSSDEARLAGVLFLAIQARCSAAQVQITQGRLSLAEQTCREAVQAAGGEAIPPLGLAWSVLGGIVLERNDIDAAEQLLRDGAALSRQGGLLDNVLYGQSHLARLLAAKGDASAAFAAVEEARQMMWYFAAPRIAAVIGATVARLQLFTGQVQAAAQWAAAYQAERAAPHLEFAELTLARVLLATGAPEAVPAVLNPILEQAARAGRKQACIETMLLLALYHRARGENAPALEWLGQSLQLAAPEGYARIYLDEGEPLLEMLPRARSAAPALVDALLKMGRPGGTPLSPNAQLPEPLSEQELRVLQLIVAGKSNREIAAELFISVGTAKWHVHNVLQKLEVSSRPQAIARARELGL